MPLSTNPAGSTGSQPFVLPASPMFASPSASSPYLYPAQGPVPPFPPSAPMSASAFRSGSKGVLIASAFMGITAFAVLGYVAFRSPAAPAPLVAPSPAANSPVAPVLTVAPEAPKAPVLLTIRLGTEPDGAIVKEDGVERCASTPCDVTYTAEAADPAKEHKYVFVKPGFRTETRIVRPGDSPFSIRLAREAVPRWVPPAATAKPEAPPPVPTGYKTDVPY